MKINTFFWIKFIKLNTTLTKKQNTYLDKSAFIKNLQITVKNQSYNTNIMIPTQLNIYLLLSSNSLPTMRLTKSFLSTSITTVKIFKTSKLSTNRNLFTFLNKFLIFFLESFFKTKLILNIKKGTNKLPIKQVSQRRFFVKYFKKNLKVHKQIIGVIYYSLLLKDSSIFVNFFRKILEKSSIKNHKKIFLGFRKLIKDIFKPLFGYLNILGIFFNIKGKIGVSGSAKKRRYFFYFGKHSITTRSLKMDCKFLPI